jgi:6,7-dimethyl-8-ribityllumazine synthase
MSTILNTEGTNVNVPTPLRGNDFKCTIVTADWNHKITDALTQGAIDTLHEAGVSDSNIILKRVPGSVELVYGAAYEVEHKTCDAVIVIGCVIRGDTPHFDYVCDIAAQGVAALNAKGTVPVIFGVLTVNELQQAVDRAGGFLGNKGSEAAVAAITMANYSVK